MNNNKNKIIKLCIIRYIFVKINKKQKKNKMKNTILNLNNYHIITSNDLLKQNKIIIKLNNSDELILINLSSSRLKLFLKYYKSSTYNKDINIEMLKRNIILEDIKNFRKYFNNYSLSYDLDKIKKIFIHNNISLETLNKYIDSVDYLWIKDLDENNLSNGVYTKRNKYNNILIDLKLESIPKEIIYNYPISLLFKFKLDKKGKYTNIQDISDKAKLEKVYSSKVTELEDKDYISLYYEIYEDDPMLNAYLDNYTEYSVYNGYCGNYETYYTFKELLKIYLEGINIYKYKDNYYSYNGIKNIYDIKSIEHSRFINDNMLEYHSNVDKAYEDLFKYNKEITTFTCNCINISENLDKEGYVIDTLSNLKLTFNIKNSNIDNNKIELHLYNFL